MAEELLDRLVAVVRDHYGATGTPLLLSRFGQTNKELLIELKAKFGTLSAAVREAGNDRLRIVDQRLGRESMAPAAVAPEVQAKIQEQSANQRQSSSSFDSLPAPVQIAFCVRTEGGEHIALRVTPPFHYEKVTSLDLLRPGYRALPEQYRKPGLELRRSSLQDREALWRAFVAWTESQGLDPAVFTSSRQSNALARLLAAQPADVIGRLVIPGDIAAFLLKRP